MPATLKAEIEYDYPRTDIVNGAKIYEGVTVTNSNGTRFNPQGYIEAVDDNTIRIDYDPLTREVIGPLIEDERTNNIVAPMDFTDASWLVVGTASVTTFTEGSPAKGSGDTVYILSGPSSGADRIYVSRPVVDTGQGIAFEVIAKTGTGDRIGVSVLASGGTTQFESALFDFNTGSWASGYSNGSETARNIGNGWWILSGYLTLNNTGQTDFQLRLFASNSTGGTVNVKLWHSQIEFGTKAISSPILGNLTRTVDSLVIDGDDFTNFWNEDEGTWLAEITIRSTSGQNNFIFDVDNGTGAERYIMNVNISAANKWQAYGSGLTQNLTVGSYNDGVTEGYALAYDATDIIGSNDGSAVVSGAYTRPSGLTRMGVGQDPDGSNFLNGHLKKLIYYPQRLTDAELETRSVVGWQNETLEVCTKPISDFLPRITRRPRYSAKVGLWIWNSSPRSVVGELELVNTDGALDFLLERQLRDKPVTLKTLAPGGGVDDFVTVANVVTDNVSATPSRSIRFKFAPLDITLQEVFEEKVYPSTVPNANLAGKLMYTCLGECNQMPTLLYDASTPEYHFHDNCQIFEQGIMDAPKSNGESFLPSQYTEVCQGFTCSITPAGKVTASITGTPSLCALTSVIEQIISNGKYDFDQIYTGRGKFPNFNSLDLGYIGAYTGDPIVGVFLKSPRKTAEILQELLDPFMSSSYVDALGVLRFGQLQDPDLILGDSLALNEENIISVTVEDDLMPGLTNDFAGGRNWAVLSEETSAGGLTLQEKDDAAQEFRIISRGEPTAIAPFYRWAQDAESFKTPIQRQADLDAAVEYISSIASERRRFYRVRAILPDQGEIELFEKATLTWPQYGLDAGLPMQIVGYEFLFGDDTVEFILWR